MSTYGESGLQAWEERPQLLVVFCPMLEGDYKLHPQTANH